MTTVTSDTIGSGTISKGSDGVTTLLRVFIVEGVSGTATTRPATAFEATGIPDVGDQHPDYSAFYCHNKTQEVLEPTTYRIKCEYKDSNNYRNVDSGSQVSIGATVQTQRTNKDKDGSVIQVGSLDPDADPKPVETKTTKYKQGAMVDKQVPVLALNYSRLETSDPTSTIKSYVGKRNSGSFNGFAAKELLCTRITARSNDGGNTYEMEYEFQYDPNKWDATVTYIDPETGVPPQAVSGVTNGIETFEIYDTADYDTLDL